jgi:hypothetical protein
LSPARRHNALNASVAFGGCPRPGAVAIDVATFLIEFQSSGRLMPWLGPAVRGVVAGRFRERHCVLPLAEQAGRWRRCRGCRHLRDCAYGSIFEPDEQVLQRVAASATGDHDVPRCVVLAPAFPAPVRAERGLRLPVSIVAIGAAARASFAEVAEVLGEAGRAGVFGTDRLRFAVVKRRGAPMQLSLDAAGLPDGSGEPCGVVPRVRVTLTSPLFLRDRDAAGRPVPCRAPSLHRRWRWRTPFRWRPTPAGSSRGAATFGPSRRRGSRSIRKSTPIAAGAGSLCAGWSARPCSPTCRGRRFRGWHWPASCTWVGTASQALAGGGWNLAGKHVA